MTIELRLLGGFEATVDGVPVAPEQWTRRQAASLVKVLALAPGRRLHREQVIEALWPRASVEAAGPRLHKAAHYARRALGGDGSALLLRNDMVALLPDSDVRIDVDEFRERAGHAIEVGTPEAANLALAEYDGQLLPDDLYESWAEDARDAVRMTRVELLRQAERWDDVLAEDATDEAAHLALINGHADRGDVRAALRQFERLDHALVRELGTTPSPEAERLRARLHAQSGRTENASQGVRLVGRRTIGDQIREAMSRADEGRGSTLLFSGLPGVGKTAVMGLAEALARQRDWRTGRGTASAVEGPWPYAPVLEAFGELCRKHPALLDGLDDRFRLEIERALSGRDVSWTGESSHQRLFVAVAELMRLAGDRPRPADRRRRPAGRRRGVPAPAALPVAVRRDRAGRHRGGAPAPGQRHRAAGGRESRTTGRGHAHRARTARPRRHPTAAHRPVPEPLARPGRGDLRAQWRPAVLRAGAGRQSRSPGCRAAAATAGRRRPRRSSARPCWARCSPPTS